MLRFCYLEDALGTTLASAFLHVSSATDLVNQLSGLCMIAGLLGPQVALPVRFHSAPVAADSIVPIPGVGRLLSAEERDLIAMLLCKLAAATLPAMGGSADDEITDAGQKAKAAAQGGGSARGALRAEWAEIG